MGDYGAEGVAAVHLIQLDTALSSHPSSYNQSSNTPPPTLVFSTTAVLVLFPAQHKLSLSSSSSRRTGTVSSKSVSSDFFLFSCMKYELQALVILM